MALVSGPADFVKAIYMTYWGPENSDIKYEVAPVSGPTNFAGCNFLFPSFNIRIYHVHSRFNWNDAIGQVEGVQP